MFKHLDANAFLRYLLNDIPAQAEEARDVIDSGAAILTREREFSRAPSSWHGICHRVGVQNERKSTMAILKKHARSRSAARCRTWLMVRPSPITPAAPVVIRGAIRSASRDEKKDLTYFIGRFKSFATNQFNIISW